MAYVRLSSMQNPVIRIVRSVAEQSRRAPPGLVLVEGLRVLEESLAAAACTTEVCLVSESFGRSRRERRLLAQWEDLGLRPYLVSSQLLRAVSGVPSPQGALALVRLPNRSLETGLTGLVPLLIVAGGIQDPGNLGTLIRTGWAAGATLACTTPGTVSARSPKAVRSSAGALFHLPLSMDVAPGEITDFCSRNDILLYRSSAHEGRLLWNADLSRPCGLVMGNEAKGVDAAAWGDLPCLRIPMSPGVESLSVASAGAVLLYEARRQRALASPPASPLVASQ